MFMSLGTAIFCTLIITAEAATSSERSTGNDSSSNPANASLHFTSSRQTSGSPTGAYKSFAIAADNGVCSDIGKQIIKDGGNAVDAAVAAQLCVGIVDPHSSGLGGGFFMTVYNRTSRKCFAINARETAPASASKQMYAGRSGDSTIGWRSIAVPGEVHGLVTSHRRFGRLPWKRVVQPAIRLANNYTVSAALSKAFAMLENDIRNEPSLSEIFIDPTTNRAYPSGSRIQRPKLKETLARLADAADPIREFYYDGITAQNIAKEFAQNGALITSNDLRNYKSEVVAPATTNLGSDLSVCGPPPPSGAVVAEAILSILSGYHLKPSDAESSLTYHRVIESMKFAYAARSELGDPKFITRAATIASNITTLRWAEYARSLTTLQAHEPTYYGAMFVQSRDAGTSQLSVLDSDGNAVSLTSSVNLFFGSQRRSRTTGIIWNDSMDDFSKPGESNTFGLAPSEANFIEPGKRPMSSMSPIIITDSTTGSVRLVTGAEGGSTICSSVAYTAARNLWLGDTIQQAIDAPRVHNQHDVPDSTTCEPAFSADLLNTLNQLYGQKIYKGYFRTSVCAIASQRDPHRPIGNVITATSDARKAGGYPAGE